MDEISPNLRPSMIPFPRDPLIDNGTLVRTGTSTGSGLDCGRPTSNPCSTLFLLPRDYFIHSNSVPPEAFGATSAMVWEKVQR
jgi:hypothetical protein